MLGKVGPEGGMGTKAMQQQLRVSYQRPSVHHLKPRDQGLTTLLLPRTDLEPLREGGWPPGAIEGDSDAEVQGTMVHVEWGVLSSSL